MSEKNKQKPFFVVTEHYLRIDNPPASCAIYSSCLLDKNDPQLDIVAEQLSMTTKELVDLLSLYFKYFPSAKQGVEMSKKLNQIKRLNKMFSDFICALADYDANKDIEVAPDVLKEEKRLAREIKDLSSWEFVKE